MKLHNISCLAGAGLCFCASAIWSSAQVVEPRRFGQPVPVATPPTTPPPTPPNLVVATPPEAAPTNGVPKIQFASTVHDFGKVSAGEIVRADFVFTNVGTKTLEILEVRPTCGCTTAGTWEKQIQPGKTGTIPLQVNTANFSGPVVKTVTVTCNDPEPGKNFIGLQIKGTIWKPVEVAPPFVMFNIAPDSVSNEVRTVKITNNMEQPLELSPPQSSSPAFQVEVAVVKPGKEFDLQITPVSPLPAGNAQASITVKTSATNMPLISITALAVVQAAVTATPAQIFLPSGPLGSPVQYTIIVQNNTTQAMAVTDVTSTLPNVQLQVREAQSNRVFHITTTFPPGFQIPFGQSAALNLKTTNPRMQTMSIPLMQPPAPVQAPPTAPPPPPPPSIARPPEQAGIAPGVIPAPAPVPAAVVSTAPAGASPASGPIPTPTPPPRPQIKLPVRPAPPTPPSPPPLLPPSSAPTQ